MVPFNPVVPLNQTAALRCFSLQQTAALLARIFNERRAPLQLKQPMRAAQRRSNINPLNGLYEVIKSQRLLRREAEINEERGWNFSLNSWVWCWTSLRRAASSYWWCTIKQRCAHLLYCEGNCSHLDAVGLTFIMLWLVINAVLMGNNDWCAFSSLTVGESVSTLLKEHDGVTAKNQIIPEIFNNYYNNVWIISRFIVWSVY